MKVRLLLEMIKKDHTPMYCPKNASVERKQRITGSAIGCSNSNICLPAGDWDVEAVVERRHRRLCQPGKTPTGFKATPYWTYHVKGFPKDQVVKYKLASGTYPNVTATGKSSAMSGGTGGVGGRPLNSTLLSYTRWAGESGYAGIAGIAADFLKSDVEASLLNNLNEVKLQLGEYVTQLLPTLNMIQARGMQLAALAFTFWRKKARDDAAYRKYLERSRSVGGWRGQELARARAANLKKFARELAGNGYGNVARQSFGSGMSLESLWLELRYAWLPLMSDIHTGVGLINQQLERNQKGAKMSVEEHKSSDAFLLPGSLSGLVSYSSKVSFSCKAKCYYKLTDGVYNSLRWAGLDNPLYIAWISISWSFVIDWIIPVSSWLQAFTGAIGFTFVSGSTSLRCVVNETAEWLVPPSPTVGQSGAWSATVEGKALRRYAHTSWPVPTLWLKSPLTGLNRLADFIALSKGRR